MILATHGIVGSSIGQFTTLLDLYPSAAAAYSLRLLRVGYTGSAIRVRRASDNTEQNIGFTALGGLDTSSLTSFCSGTNGFVTTWYDQSGNGRNATQTTAANQPQIVSSGSVILENGKPSINASSNLHYMTMTAVSFNDGFFVVKVNTQNAINYFSSPLFANGTAAGIDGFGFYQGGTPRSITGEDLNRHLAYYNAISSNGYVAKDGNSTINVGFIGSSFFNSSIILGTTFGLGFLGNAQEMIYYSSNQSSNRTGIETNINDFYSIY